MKAQRCQLKECGAVVYVLPLEQGEIAVDPQPVDVVVAEGAHYRVTHGYQPHWRSCVDIATRGQRHLARRS